MTALVGGWPAPHLRYQLLPELMTDDKHGTAKVLLAWAGTAIGALTLQEWVLITTLVYTSLQSVLALRKLLCEGEKDGGR